MPVSAAVLSFSSRVASTPYSGEPRDSRARRPGRAMMSCARVLLGFEQIQGRAHAWWCVVLLRSGRNSARRGGGRPAKRARRAAPCRLPSESRESTTCRQPYSLCMCFVEFARSPVCEPLCDRVLAGRWYVGV
jgi:hypothetical protein